MKKSFLLCALALTFTTTVMASEGTLIKSCSTSLGIPGEEIAVETNISIFQNQSSLKAIVTQNTNGHQISYDEQAVIEEHRVKAGLNSEILMSDDIDKLNPAERVIVHAMALSEGPDFEDSFSPGLDLKKVRSAKLFIVGEQTNMGMTVIVEAKDAQGKNLGSFLGGFLVSPCK